MNSVKNLNSGLFRNNAVLTLFLGLTTALAVTTSLTTALGMGIVVLLATVASAFAIGLLREFTPDEVALPVNLVVIAAIVKLCELMTRAYMAPVAKEAGVFLPLLVTNTVILVGAGVFVKDADFGLSIKEGAKLAFGYLVALVILGMFREILASGGLMFLNPMSGEEVFSFSFIPEAYRIGLFKQPAGAFISLSLISALFALKKGEKTEAPEGGK
ncbi:Rnf-Nqr domain containing protein [Youngiibacter multivorans]|uniref:Na+-translocating ferredoxin:NAD+ oxidoreductase RnfE subunit n=1 Tax=Youngiibacter multivorans TaxID=937251 RepID=A0ABS4G1B3_9CLOT|nr:Rnf-Nqr domain containing protein [Youngiibacter multivorans]MBP1918323.1 Na+-translocating ferredoxin:NAD+ oxidoreductase RnfE subunit [Youngiibacter multivorans]